MIFDAITITWNEEFLLPKYLLHYDFCRNIYVYDNGSTDGTIEIARLNPKVVLKHYETNNQQCNESMRWVKNNAYKGLDADYVIVSDCDEFLVGHENIKDVGCYIYKTQGYQMVACDPVPEDFSLITHRVRDTNYDKMICFSPKIQEIGFGYGAHRCEPQGGRIMDVGLELHHYHVLGEDYMVKRRKRYVPRMSQNDLRRGFGYHYLNAEEDIRQECRNHWEAAGGNEMVKESFGFRGKV